MVKTNHWKSQSGGGVEILAQLSIQSLLGFLRGPCRVITPSWQFVPHKLQRALDERIPDEATGDPATVWLATWGLVAHQ
jgi:hypothetical protein